MLTTGHSEGVAVSPGEFLVLPKPYEAHQLETWIRRLVRVGVAAG